MLRRGIARPQSLFPHSCVFYIFPGSVHIFSCSRIDRPILGTYKSLTDFKCGNWDCGRAIPFLRICFEFSVFYLCSASASPFFHNLALIGLDLFFRGKSGLGFYLYPLSLQLDPLFLSSLRFLFTIICHVHSIYKYTFHIFIVFLASYIVSAFFVLTCIG
jgi:hypothetical protein